MKNIIFTLLFALGCALCQAQVDLPDLSPKAFVGATVGLTKITIDYSSPAVRKREIWGKLVPWNQVWRAGANEPTTIQFETSVEIGGTVIPAGKYAFFLIPRAKGTWTAIINSDWQQWGAYRYDTANDLVRLEIKPTKSTETIEHLRYTMDSYTIDGGVITMAWERLSVSMPFYVETKKMALENIKSSLDTVNADDKWVVHAYAAQYHLMNEDDPKKALQHSTEAASLMPNVWVLWIHARILAWNKKYPEAIETLGKMEKASTLDKDETFYYNQLLGDIQGSKELWEGLK
jgi:Protein of unknown function (DUF2911)